jgi:hypothetical protein
MYEGWHIEYSNHALRRMVERSIGKEEVLATVTQPDRTEADALYGGRLICRYLPDWDRILVVCVEEHADKAVLLVKTVLWSPAR